MNSPEIIVNQINDSPNFTFEVTINEDLSSTRHLVTMEKDFYKDLNSQITPDKIIEKSFRFLLTKESKEMIYSKFDVSVISNYYPEFLEHLQEVLN